MSYTKRKLEELNVIDDFLMNSLVADRTVGEKFCKILLSTLLQREIGKVRMTIQKTIPPANPDLRGIRLDVKVEEIISPKGSANETIINIYDIEPHLTKSTDIPRHNRFYQALTDSNNLKSGENDFANLPNLYILMILDKDPFGYDYMMYSIWNKCNEVEELEYKDGLRFYYFYTHGNNGGNDAIKAMLRYISDSRQENATDAATKQIHKFTEKVKINPEVKKGYMFWEEYVEILKDELREELREEFREELREELKEEFTESYKAKLRESIETELKESIETEFKMKNNKMQE